MSAHFLLSQPDAVDSVAATVRPMLEARIDDYVGRSGWHRPASTSSKPPFGWKDPRNTFTLPVWRRVFPHARTLHVVRHGVDVAASLARRHAAALHAATGNRRPPALTVIQDHALGVLSSRRGWTLCEALTMWEQYVEKARIEMAECEARSLEVRFEELLARPEQVTQRIAEFCEIEATAPLDGWFGNIRSSRAFAYRDDPELATFAVTGRAALERYGYAP
jgi:hypothetical protein